MTKDTEENDLIETKILLARIDERTANLESDVKSIIDQLARNYVTKEEFDPVKRVVYGLLGIILVAVVTAILKLVIFT